MIRSVTNSGKIISNNMFVEEGEIIFDSFNSLEKKENLDIRIKVIALEKSVLEEITLKKNRDKEIYKTMLTQLMKKNVEELDYHIYPSKGCILSMLKRCAGKDGTINKKNIKPDLFYLGKTQFYKLYKEIKDEEFIKGQKEKIYLDIFKIDNYLSELKNMNV
ncbi:MAG: hypothetical protein ACRC0S_00115 [Fusobacteriaceae bacterium]